MMTGDEGIDEIAEAQGWSAETLLSLLGDFIASNDLSVKVAEFLEEIAEEENAE